MKKFYNLGALSASMLFANSVFSFLAVHWLNCSEVYFQFCFFSCIFSSPGQSPGRAIVLPPALASVLAAASALAKC